MRYFVLNAYDDRSEKYKHDDRYELIKPTHYKDISVDVMDEYYFKLFPKEDFKRKVISCAEGHKSLLKKIIDEDLKDVVMQLDKKLSKEEKEFEVRNHYTNETVKVKYTEGTLNPVICDQKNPYNKVLVYLVLLKLVLYQQLKQVLLNN